MSRFLKPLLAVSVLTFLSFLSDVAFADIPGPEGNCDSCTLLGREPTNPDLLGFTTLFLIVLFVVGRLRRRT